MITACLQYRQLSSMNWKQFADIDLMIIIITKYSAMQGQKAVHAYILSKQFLLFDLAT